MMGNETNKGLYKLAVEDIFQQKAPNQNILVSFYEIYCSKIYDLLNNRNKLVLREDGNANVNVVGLLEVAVDSSDELLLCVEAGDEQRMTSATMANYDSSRSHAILQIRIMENEKEIGKVSFIDLAGNERGADTYDNDKQTRLDGAEINKSLLALKECIRALDQDKKHTPFRGSKLTLVLKDSFIGNCKTIMIANVNPSGSCSELTLNTLRYADRVKELSNDKSSKEKIGSYDALANKLMLPRQANKSNLPPLPSKKGSQQGGGYSDNGDEEIPNQFKIKALDFQQKIGSERIREVPKPAQIDRNISGDDRRDFFERDRGKIGSLREDTGGRQLPAIPMKRSSSRSHSANKQPVKSISVSKSGDSKLTRKYDPTTPSPTRCRTIAETHPQRQSAFKGRRETSFPASKHHQGQTA
jgi:hypothetical protein